jgi:hypothetical protein
MTLLLIKWSRLVNRSKTKPISRTRHLKTGPFDNQTQKCPKNDHSKIGWSGFQMLTVHNFIPHACQLVHVIHIYFVQAIWNRVSFLKVIFQVHLDFPNQSYRNVFNGKVISLQSRLPGSKWKWQGKGTCWDIISSKQMKEVLCLQVNKFFLLDWRFC